MNALSVGQVSAPVKTTLLNGGGYFIIKVTDIKPAHKQTFDEVKDSIKQNLEMENQRKAIDAWLARVRDNYTIEYAEEFKPTPTTAGTTATGATTATQAKPATP